MTRKPKVTIKTITRKNGVTSQKTRITATTRVIRAGCLTCNPGGAERWHSVDSTGAMSAAARHNDASGHVTWAKMVMEVRYGVTEIGIGEKGYEPIGLDDGAPLYFDRDDALGSLYRFTAACKRDGERKERRVEAAQIRGRKRIAKMRGVRGAAARGVEVDEVEDGADGADGVFEGELTVGDGNLDEALSRLDAEMAMTTVRKPLIIPPVPPRSRR